MSWVARATEDQQVFSSDNVTDSDLSACDDGYLDVIDTAGDEPKQYSNGKWHKLLEWGSDA